MPDGGTVRYRPSVVEQLWRHGVHPTEQTRPELVRDFVRDLYKYEIRALRLRLQRQEFPRHEYAGRVEQLRRRYSVLALLPHQFLEDGSGSGAPLRGETRHMMAVEIRGSGPPDVLTLVERPKPAAGRGEVLIKVAAAGVNRPDVMQRLGRYPPPPGASDIPGLEVAGTIESAGADAGGWRSGDQVCALVSGGGYAEYCVAPAAQCLPVPKGMDLTHAAAVPETTFTVWTNVFERGRLAPDELILIHGGSSGIGTAAIQLARAFGARVFATAGSAEKCAACQSIGAERTFNYRETDFVAGVREATGGRGVDVVLDIVGGDYLQRNIDSLALDGRVVLIGQLGGPHAQIRTLPILQRRLTITGSTLRARTVEEKGAIGRAVHKRVWPLFESGVVRVLLHATFPIAAAAEAHRVMEAGTHIGKLVLTVG